LLGFEHDVSCTASIAEAGAMTGDAPTLVVVSCDALRDAGLTATLPLNAGGALIIYGSSHDDRPFLATKLQRATLAHLVLPLERHRLVALVKSFDNRSRTTGRSIREDYLDDSQLEF
jgi:hypothetical protein